MNVKLVYDQNEKLSYGCYHCPVCGSQFYGGGPAIHEAGCTLDGYDGVEYHFGDAQVSKVKEIGASLGKNHAWYGISLEQLERLFPELL